MKLKKIGYMIPITHEFLHPEKYAPKGHVVTTSKTDEWLAERDAFVAAWQAMTEQGIDLGFLDYDHCYECGREVIPTTHTDDHKWVSDE